MVKKALIFQLDKSRFRIIVLAIHYKYSNHPIALLIILSIL